MVFYSEVFTLKHTFPTILTHSNDAKKDKFPPSSKTAGRRDASQCGAVFRCPSRLLQPDATLLKALSHRLLSTATQVLLDKRILQRLASRNKTVVIRAGTSAFLPLDGRSDALLPGIVENLNAGISLRVLLAIADLGFGRRLLRHGPAHALARLHPAVRRRHFAGRRPRLSPPLLLLLLRNAVGRFVGVDGKRLELGCRLFHVRALYVDGHFALAPESLQLGETALDFGELCPCLADHAVCCLEAALERVERGADCAVRRLIGLVHGLRRKQC
ncbi:hypothetical protein HDK77DRAFT_122840 [Phyllosticta capitalensis]